MQSYSWLDLHKNKQHRRTSCGYGLSGSAREGTYLSNYQFLVNRAKLENLGKKTEICNKEEKSLKKAIIFSLFILASTRIGFSTTHIITNSGFTFSPSSITISLGDTVEFVLASIHAAREVNQATWNADGNTSNGGFDLPFGGGTVVLTQTGIHYYVCPPHASLGMKGTITVNSATHVMTAGGGIPVKFALMQNYPNPFNPTTTIHYELPTSSKVTLKIYDVLGQEVKTLVDGVEAGGYRSVTWDGTSDSGTRVASGVFFYRLEAGIFTDTKRLLLLK